MDRWYLITSKEAEKGMKVAILDILEEKEIDRAILIEDPEVTSRPEAVAGYVGVRTRSLTNPAIERQFFADSGQWFQFIPNDMTEELCAVTQGPMRLFGFVGQI